MNRFLVLSLIILAIFLGGPIVEGDVSYDVSDADPESYGEFIADLRNALPSNRQIYGIPLLLPSMVPSPKRYMLMHLSVGGKTITAAIDVINVYIIGYLSETTSYFFNESAAQVAAKFVFTDAKMKITLPYSSNYQSLQNAANKIRENIPLGLQALAGAIETLYRYESSKAARAFLILIQTTAEASRYKYIEREIKSRAYVDKNPGLAMLSLENNWSALSKQIQIAETKNGNFEATIVLTGNSGQRIEVNNVSSPVVTNNIKLLLNAQNVEAFDKDISSISDLGNYATI